MKHQIRNAILLGMAPLWLYLPFLLFQVIQDQPVGKPPGVYSNCESGALGGMPGIGSFAPCTTTSTLLNQLIAYWKLDELSGTRAKTAGSCSSCDLTAVNAPDTAAGAGTYALSLDGSSQYLSISSNSSLQVSGEFGVCAWVRPTSIGAGTGPIANKDNSGGNREYSLYRSTAAVGFLVGDGTGGAPQSITTGTMTAATRNFACGWWQSSDSKVRVSLNNGTAAVSAGTITPGSAANSFYIGYDGTNYQGGMIGPVYFWKGAYPSSSQITSVYNSGSGKRCADLSGADKTNMTSCWELGEASGSRADSIGSNTLSATNAPGRLAGLVQNGMGLSAWFNGSQGLVVGDNADLSSSGTAMTAVAWVDFASQGSPVTEDIIGKDNNAGASVEWQLRSVVRSSDIYWKFLGASFSIDSNGTYQSGAYGPGPWILVAGRLSSSWVPRLTLNSAVTWTGSAGSGPADGSAPLTIGCLGQSPATCQAYYATSAAIDAAGFWKRELSDSELTALYASGSGVEYPWSSIVSLWEPPIRWADRPISERQRIVWAKTGVYVPAFMFPGKVR